MVTQARQDSDIRLQDRSWQAIAIANASSPLLGARVGPGRLLRTGRSSPRMSHAPPGEGKGATDAEAPLDRLDVDLLDADDLRSPELMDGREDVDLDLSL